MKVQVRAITEYQLTLCPPALVVAPSTSPQRLSFSHALKWPRQAPYA